MQTAENTDNLKSTESLYSQVTVSRADTQETLSETVVFTETVSGSETTVNLDTVEGLLLLLCVMVGLLIGTLWSNIFFKRGGG